MSVLDAHPPCAFCMMMRRISMAILPVLSVVSVIVAIWYGGAYLMNRWAPLDTAERRGVELSLSEVFADTMAQERPRLPAPHQVAAELWNTTVGEDLFRERRGEMRPNPRNLLFHAYQTLAPTLLGFVIGSLAGLLLAIGIVHNRAMDLSVMPWAIASQTIPILAVAPIVIVVLNAVGLSGLVPKSLISAYLSFFPVVVGMVKGLRSPDAMQLDLMRTYSASGLQSLWKLRLPASLPYLFTSMKIAMAAALVGTIVGELPTGAVEGLGSRLLAGSQFGQPLKVWSALFAAAILSMVMIALIGVVGRMVERRMGMAR